MYDQVIFYLAFGSGDIFESREFVKEWMRLVPAKKYCYAHGKNPRILKDIPNLEFKEFTVHMDSMKSVWDDDNGNLYVNCWIGRDGKYVLPGIGCTAEKLYQMHNDMLAVYGFGKLSGEPIDYIPRIYYDAYEIDEPTKFVFEKKEELIFIDNGNVQSMQAENFNFNPIIRDIADTYPDKIFIVTHPIITNQENIFYTGNIIKQGLGFDLNEVSYLSLFCSTLIGRNSGPHVHTQVYQNVMDFKKKLLSFTYHPRGASFVVNTDVLIRRFWSGATNQQEVFNKICEVLEV
jgi:hypothetical protein